MKEKIETEIKNVLESQGITDINFSVEYPGEFSHGDFATNVSLVAGKKFGKDSLVLAREIAEQINSKKIEDIESVEVAGPGFINFKLSKKFFENSVKDVINQSQLFGSNSFLNGEKTIVEYTDPNPFKEFHIGHLMSNTIGEALSRLAEANGAEVKRANWQGDIGLHVAKAVWGMNQNSASLPEQNSDLQRKVDFLAKSYAFGASQFESNEEAKKEIIDVNKKLFDKSDKNLQKLYDDGRAWSLEAFEDMYQVLGTKFDFYFFESEEGERGKRVVMDNLSNGIFERSEGAVVYKGEEDGLHTRVFVNSIGLPTYEAKELGLAMAKYEKYQYDKSIIITGNEINEYFKVIFAVMKKVFPDIYQKTFHISHGMLRLPSGKMSSRTGDVITGRGMIKEVQDKIKEKMSYRNLNEEEIESISKQISVGAIKYSILKQSPGKDIIFDFEKSISFEGDSGPYIQYTITRANSILEKAKEAGIETGKIEMPENWEITNLEKLLHRMPNVVKKSYLEYAPQHLVNYLTELSSAFNSFYGQEQIVKEGDDSSLYKVSLTEAVKMALQNGLKILGIESPERM